MKEIYNILRDFIKQNRTLVLVYGIGAILITLSSIVLISGNIGDGYDKKVEYSTVVEGNLDTIPNQDSPSDDWEVLPTKSPTVAPELGETDVGDRKSITDVEVPEITEEADAHDPQMQGTTGVEMNITDIEVKESNKETITYGIDVAKWQGVIDWKKVKNAGVTFAMIRVGYRTLDNGVIVEDLYAKYNLQQAVKYGIQIGVYFFSTAIDEREAKEEAAWVADFIAPYPITYPVAYNCEGFTNPKNRQYGMSNADRTKMAVTFLDYIQKQGYTPIFYAAKNELENNSQWDTDILSQKYKIWVAHYPETLDKNMKSSYTGKYAMWQYTSKGSVPGIEKPVDLNIAYFGYEKTAKPKDDTPQKEVTADPAALINFKQVEEEVTAKIETNLRSVPSTRDSNTIVAVLKNGDIALRTGIGDNGWSRVEYNGKILYAVSSYLTTDLEYQQPSPTPMETGPKYQEVNEKVTAKEKTNLRSEPSTENDDTIKEVLYYGDIAIRTGIGDNGWSRVEYNGKVLYALSKYLTTDLNYQDNRKPTLDNPEAGITFTEVHEKVTAKEVTNLRLVPSTAVDGTVAAVLTNGDIAIRTGIGDNGWSRVEFDGKVLYAVTNYLKVVE